MAGKVCVVVGIGPGIGGCVAQKFAKEGYQVAVTARTEEKVNTMAAEIGGKGYAYDCTDAAATTEALKKIRADFGQPIHTLIYNAGQGAFNSFDETTPEIFERCWKTNSQGLFFHAKEVAEEMKANGGVIGVTGATASWRGMPATSAFAPAKAAQRLLCQSLARELGPKGVHVFMAVIDGVVDIPTSRQRMPNKPDNEWLSPAAIADTYFSVASQPASCWTTEINVVPGAVMGSMATI